MAMSLQRSHAKCLGEGDGLSVGRLSRVDLCWLAACLDVAEEMDGVRLVSSCLIGARDITRVHGARVRLLQAPSQEVPSPSQVTDRAWSPINRIEAACATACLAAQRFRSCPPRP